MKEEFVNMTRKKVCGGEFQSERIPWGQQDTTCHNPRLHGKNTRLHQRQAKRTENCLKAVTVFRFLPDFIFEYDELRCAPWANPRWLPCSSRLYIPNNPVNMMNGFVRWAKQRYVYGCIGGYFICGLASRNEGGCRAELTWNALSSMIDIVGSVPHQVYDSSLTNDPAQEWKRICDSLWLSKIEPKVKRPLPQQHKKLVFSFLKFNIVLRGAFILKLLIWAHNMYLYIHTLHDSQVYAWYSLDMYPNNVCLEAKIRQCKTLDG